MITDRKHTVLLDLVASPFFLTLPITIVLILLLPHPASKYKLNLVKRELAAKANSVEYFYDLNGNGRDERVVVFNNPITGKAAIKILTNDGSTYEQWNFPGYFHHFSTNTYCTDLNNDGLAEIYAFYYLNDSVFMGVIQPFPNREMLQQKRFVTKIWKKDGGIDYSICNFKTVDLNNNGTKQILFRLTAGYSLQPRALFVYDGYRDTLYHSKSFGAKIGNIAVSDLDNDSFPEIFCGSNASGNIHDSIRFPYHDYNSWFMVFNHNLQLMFPPIANKGMGASVKVTPFTNAEGKKFIVAYYNNSYKENKPKGCKLVFYQSNGKEYSSKFFHLENENDHVIGNVIPIENFNRKPYICFGKINGFLIFCNEDFKIKKIKSCTSNMGLILMDDLNSDGKKEYVYRNREGSYLTICDAHFSNPVTIKTNIKIYPGNYVYCDVKHNGSNKQNELFIKSGEHISFYHYQKNRLYYLKYPMWLLIYMLTTLFVWFVQRMQQLQIKRKQQLEETINTLQLQTIKNQMDPHFIFNVLNGIANKVSKGNANESYTILVNFSKLLRSLMNKAEKMDVTLASELDFVRNYLQLEKFRFSDNFDYLIEVEEGVDTNLPLPRMLIQLLVENSIKHGLSNKTGQKFIKVTVRAKTGKTVITVEDNGIGRKAAKQRGTDSGKGMKLIHQMIRLHRKLEGKIISVNYTDIYHTNGTAIGTKVNVTIENEDKRKTK